MNHNKDNAHTKVESKQKSLDALNEPLHGQVSLTCAVEQTLRSYFTNLEGQAPTALYELVSLEVERPLFKIVMEYCEGNQSKAAKVLGINRNTLRSKLKNHNLL